MLDVGANTGWFSQIAVKMGYKVHAVDEQPLCILHIVTNARKNAATDDVIVHNLGKYPFIPYCKTKQVSNLSLWLQLSAHKQVVH